MKINRVDRVANCATGYKRTAQAEMAEAVDPCNFLEVQRLLEKRAWFLLKVRPGEEFKVIRRLGERRLFAATPKDERWRFWNRYQDEKTKREFPALPGYVAVAMPLDPRQRNLRWFTLMNCEGVTGIMGEDLCGHPLRLRPDHVLSFTHDLSSDAPDEQAYMSSNAEFQEGDEVRVSDPRHPLAGQAGRALKVIEDRTEVFLEFLGTLRRVSIPTRALAGVAT